MDNLVKMFADMVTPQLADAAADMIGERSETVGAAMKVVAPLLVGALSSKGSSPSGAKQIMDILGQNPGLDSIAKNPISQLMDGGSSNNLLNLGEMLLPMVLGNKTGGITDALISLTGMKKSSAGSLLGLAAPLLLGVVKKSMNGKSMDASGLAGLLAGQKDFVKAATPPSLNLGELLGDKSFAFTNPQPSRDTITVPKVEPVQKRGGLGWLVPLLLLLAVAALLWYVMGSSLMPTLPTVNTNIGACTSIATLEKSVTDTVAGFNADTKVSEVKSWYVTLNDHYKTVTDAAAAVGKLDISGLQGTLTNLETTINSLGGETLGDGLKAIQDGSAALVSTVATLKNTVGCQ